MKRYLIFAGDQYYPCGGWDDFKTSVDDLDAVNAWLRENLPRGYDWHQIVDTTTGKEI